MLAFDDLVHGHVERDVAAGGDFVVRRADGLHAYQLAVVVDDGAIGVTHVLRGDDLLSSTPRQMLLQRLLGLPSPVYAHVPLMRAPTGERLAKRHGSETLQSLRAAGSTPGRSSASWPPRSVSRPPGEQLTAERAHPALRPAAVG